eukprot:Opistho-2@7170
MLRLAPLFSLGRGMVRGCAQAITGAPAAPMRTKMTLAKRMRKRNPSPTVNVILTNDVAGQGMSGTVVAVKRGYMRNMLDPTNQAVYATPDQLEAYGLVAPKKSRIGGERLTLIQKMSALMTKPVAMPDMYRGHLTPQEVSTAIHMNKNILVSPSAIKVTDSSDHTDQEVNLSIQGTDIPVNIEFVPFTPPGTEKVEVVAKVDTPEEEEAKRLAEEKAALRKERKISRDNYIAARLAHAVARKEKRKKRK